MLHHSIGELNINDSSNLIETMKKEKNSEWKVQAFY